MYSSSTSNNQQHQRLFDIIPSDLDNLKSCQNFQYHRFMKALGVQLLLFGGWIPTNNNTKSWYKDVESSPLTLQERLQRITPTYKPGGSIDYTFASPIGISQDQMYRITDNKQQHFNSIEELTNHLQTHIGLSVTDFDDDITLTTLQTMLSWNNTKVYVSSPQLSASLRPLLLLIFSFDATSSCRSTGDCPMPGPTNELLAATAAQFIQQHRDNNLHIIAQWEVVEALKNNHADVIAGIRVAAVGTPGTFQNTAEIFELMLCNVHIDENFQKSDIKQQQQQAILVAHPDHLRRVLWTSQTILQQQQPDNHLSLRRIHKDNVEDRCVLPRNIKLDLIPAMNPYSIDWTSRKEETNDHEESLNLFELVKSAHVHSQGQELVTSWYDNQKWGYFPDGDPQKWTHQREVWMLYDQWAIATGIVTGTIDPSLIVTKISSSNQFFFVQLLSSSNHFFFSTFNCLKSHAGLFYYDIKYLFKLFGFIVF